MEHLFTIFIASVLINNWVFAQYLGLCIFFGVTSKMETSIGMSITFTSVMIIAAAINWVLFTYVLVPFKLTFLMIVVFVGVIAAFVQTAEIIMRKIAPGLYYKLGIYLALIITNCIIVAVPLHVTAAKYNFLEALALGAGAGIGFSLALIIMASIREKLQLADVPKTFQGLPISFIITGLICLGFMGFAGIIAE